MPRTVRTEAETPSRRRRQELRIEELRRALEPFASIAVPGRPPYLDKNDSIQINRHGDACEITAGDISKARKVFTKDDPSIDELKNALEPFSRLPLDRDYRQRLDEPIFLFLNDIGGTIAVTYATIKMARDLCRQRD